MLGFHSASAVIQVAGAPIPPELRTRLYSVVVDNCRNQPDMFEITFTDDQHNAATEGRFAIGCSVEIKVATDKSPGGASLFTGKVGSIEVRYEPSAGSTTVIRGFDRTHRLFYGRTTQAYKNASYSDIAKKVAARNGLSPLSIDSTGVIFDHVPQVNSSDWQFLEGLAAEVGYEMGWVDGKFKFGKPTPASTGPQPGDLQSTNPLQLVLGAQLVSLRAAVSAAEQVKDVTVRGWDMKGKKAVVGRGGTPRSGSTASAAKPAALAAAFGNNSHTVSAVVDQQKSAEMLAGAIADQIADASVELDGVALGNPTLKAGTAVSLGNCGAMFDGKYVLTTTRHVIDSEGYQTFFTVSGRQHRSLYGLASGGASALGSGPNRHIPGVVAAIVTNLKDPENLGRMKVKFPWLDDAYESDWARVVADGAGNKYGSLALPSVDDEVLVAFEFGDVRRPFVVGGLYNGYNKPNPGEFPLISSGGRAQWRGIYSPAGHMVVLLEGDKNGVQVGTAESVSTIFLDAAGALKAKVTLTKGSVEIEADEDLKVTCQGNVTIKALVNASVEANGKVSVEAPQIELKARSGITIDGGPMVTVKGGIIKLN